MRPRLFVIDSSHPCRCVELAFALKRVSYTRVVLPPLWHGPILQLRVGSSTVPVLELGDRILPHSEDILSWLDDVQPEPPLLPRDPARRDAVYEAELWAREELQERARRLNWIALMRRPRPRAELRQRRWRYLTFQLSDLAERRFSGDLEVLVQEDVAALGADLDRVDAWITDGTIGGVSPNVADLHIGSSLWLLRRLPDVDRAIARRPCGELSRRWFGEPSMTVGAIGFRDVERDLLSG